MKSRTVLFYLASLLLGLWTANAWAEPCAEDLCMNIHNDLEASCTELSNVTKAKPESLSIPIKKGNSSCECSCDLAPLKAKLAAIEAKKKADEEKKMADDLVQRIKEATLILSERQKEPAPKKASPKPKKKEAVERREPTRVGREKI